MEINRRQFERELSTKLKDLGFFIRAHFDKNGYPSSNRTTMSRHFSWDGERCFDITFTIKPHNPEKTDEG